MQSRRLIATIPVSFAICVAVCGCAGQQLSFPKLFTDGETPNSVETVTTQPAPRIGDVASKESHPTGESPFLDPPVHTNQTAGANTSMKPAIDDMPFPQFSDATQKRIVAAFRDSSPEDRKAAYNILRQFDESKVEPMLTLLGNTALRGSERFSDDPPYGRVSQTAFEPQRSDADRYPPYVDKQDAHGPATHNTVVRPGPRVATHHDRYPEHVGEYRPRVAPGEVVDRRRPPRASRDDYYTPRDDNYTQSDAAYGRDPNERSLHGSQSAVARSENDRENDREGRSPAAEQNRQASWPPNDSLAADRPPAGRSSAGRNNGDVRNSGYVEMPQSSSEIQPTSVAASSPKDEGKYALSNGWDTQLSRVIGIIEDDIAKRPAPANDGERADRIKLQTYLRLLYLMDGQETRSLQAIPEMRPAHQEFWTQLFWGLTNYFDNDGIPDPGHRATETITQLRAAIEKLKPESRLQLRNATFSHKINSFGNYERFDRDEFTAGQPVLVYVEVQNFASEMGTEGLYRTRLRSSIEVHRVERGRSSEVVHTQKIPATEDTCRNLRQDYFHSYLLDLPANLSPGPHVLKLMVEDELSHRVATASLNFVIQ